MTRPRRKRVRLPVLGNDADHLVAQEWFPAAVRRDKAGMVQRDKLGRLQVRVRPAPRHSPETERDSEIDVEPLPIQGPDGPYSDVESYRQYVKLRAARALVGTWSPSDAPRPRTRGECDPMRHVEGCRFPRCRHFLWRVEEPAGRPGLSAVPRDQRGWTERVLGEMGPRSPMQLEPRWLEGGTLPPSCALDVADKGPHTTEALVPATNRHRTLTARLIRRALARMRDEHNLTAQDVERLLDPHHVENENREPSRRATGRRGSGAR